MAAAEADIVELRFPDKFIWGCATAAFQIEGAASKGGRTPCIWDTFCANSGKVKDQANGEVACDHYNRFKEDVKLMKELGFGAYRFSISWSRVLPQGRGEVNSEGIAFYNALIDELLAAGILPCATLYHWDLPQCLEDEYGGWLGRQVIQDFKEFSAVCFGAFGDRVKYWITINEPWCCAAIGYSVAEHAPGHASPTEVYTSGHNLLLAHAAAVRCYRADFHPKQQGQIGITLNTDWFQGLTTSEVDNEAAQRAMDFHLGWFADPCFKGDYPESMKKYCGARLPTFTAEERELMRGTSDFLGLNHYGTAYCKAPKNDGPASSLSMWGTKQVGNYFEDQCVDKEGDPRWKKTHMGWSVVPWGLCRLLKYLTETYRPTHGVIVTENGCAVHEDDVEVAKKDTFRVEYFQGYCAQMHQAIQEGADVRGYFSWSFMDNFEWTHGYTKRFGMVYVDYETQKRTPKASAFLMGETSKTNTLRLPASVLAASQYSPLEGTEESPEAKRARVSKI